MLPTANNRENSSSHPITTSKSNNKNIGLTEMYGVGGGQRPRAVVNWMNARGNGSVLCRVVGVIKSEQ